MPSLKQQLLEEFDRVFSTINKERVGKIGKNSARLFLAYSIDKLIETTNRCRPKERTIITYDPESRSEVHQIIDKVQPHIDGGFNECLSEFEKNWKEQIG